MQTYWVSFATADKFLGVAIVDAGNDADAIAIINKTIELGCNPGDGSIRIQEIPPDSRIPSAYKNRLLTADEATFLIEGGRSH